MNQIYWEILLRSREIFDAWKGDNRKRKKKGFALNIGACGVVDAELWGMSEGLKMAWNHGCRRLCLESDSQLAVNMVVNGVEDSHCAAPLSGHRCPLGLQSLVAQPSEVGVLIDEDMLGQLSFRCGT
ncbi:ribonuclease H [Senna tora]|uniref:Ribonuclease H n=1 Tax=Senna tora TaxID=362788 RepID=A0A834WKP7_9FABA|nr:ribonuclease H [Senna tora]